jgi:integrase
MRFLAPIEIARLADAMDPRYRSLVLVACYRGLRLGELAGLRRSQADLDARTIRVVENAVEVHGHIVRGAPKTNASRRTVPVAATIAAELEHHLATPTRRPAGTPRCSPAPAAGRCGHVRGRLERSLKPSSPNSSYWCSHL